MSADLCEYNRALHLALVSSIVLMQRAMVQTKLCFSSHCHYLLQKGSFLRTVNMGGLQTFAAFAKSLEGHVEADIHSSIGCLQSV